MIKHLFFVITFFISISAFSQADHSWKLLSSDSTSIDTARAEKKLARIKRREARKLKNTRPYDALAPSKAAFYSAVLPGLGQAYNGQYWKIPIVYGALGTGIGIAIWNQNQFDDLRDIYKNRLLGITTDRFFDQENNVAIVSDESLVSAFENFEQQRDLSILISVGIYVLNIIDANVTAHLQQYNLNKNLTLNPKIDLGDFTNGPNYGLSLGYTF